jgi:hypothetical protein
MQEVHMRQRLQKASALLAALVLVACSNGSNGEEAVARIDRQCAQRDIAAIILIEDHGDIGELPPEELAGAWQTLLDARTACSEGRVSAAIALYQTILDLGSPRTVMKVRQGRPGQSRK